MVRFFFFFDTMEKFNFQWGKIVGAFKNKMSENDLFVMTSYKSTNTSGKSKGIIIIHNVFWYYLYLSLAWALSAARRSSAAMSQLDSTIFTTHLEQKKCRYRINWIKPRDESISIHPTPKRYRLINQLMRIFSVIIRRDYSSNSSEKFPFSFDVRLTIWFHR